MWSPFRACGIPVAFLLLPISFRVIASELPYNPTQILVAENSGTAYILRPASSGFELASIDLTAAISVPSPSVKSIQSPISFLSGPSLSVSSTIDSNGTITVYSGNCTDPASSSQVWSLSTTDIKGSSVTWTEVQT